MEDRRSEVRMLCADVVDVRWIDGAGKSHSTTGLLEDISSSGACLQLEGAAPLGADICWRSEDHEFQGKVRYCVYREIGYFVGVEFAPGLTWSPGTFEPQHLLDLKKLLD